MSILCKQYKRRKPPDKTDKGTVAVNEVSPYYGDEVPHPFLDDYGYAVDYMHPATRERFLDLVADGGQSYWAACLAVLVLGAHSEKKPQAGMVPCYRDGNVQNCHVDNLFWGWPKNPFCGMRLAGLPTSFRIKYLPSS